MKNQAEVKFVALFCRDGNKVPRTEQQESEYIKAGVNCAGGFQFRAINADDVPAITGVEYHSEFAKFCYQDGGKLIVTIADADAFIATNPNVEISIC